MYGRLGASVRNRAGLAYYSLSRINASFGPGTWRMLAGVNPANVDKTVKLMMREAERMDWDAYARTREYVWSVLQALDERG